MNSTGLPDAYSDLTKSDILYGKGSGLFPTTPTPHMNDSTHHPQHRRTGSQTCWDRLLLRRHAGSPGLIWFEFIHTNHCRC